MKKILNLLVTLVLYSLITSTMFAQQLNKSGFEQKTSNNLSTQNETVNFDKIEAYSNGNGVFIKWATTYEFENLGFDIYRVEGENSIKANRHVVPSTYFQSKIRNDRGGIYAFFDPNGTLGSVYQIKNINLGGRNLSSRVFYPKYENNLYKVSGSTNQDLQKRTRESNGDVVKSAPNLPADLKAAANASNSLTDINRQFEVAALPGVKIAVKTKGMYRVPRADLQAAGFDTNSDTALWQLYLNGIEQSINVINDGDFVEFYGQGIDTIDSDTNIYFLIVGSVQGKRMGTTFRRRIGGNVVGKNFAFRAEKFERLIYLGDVLNGDEQNYFGTVITTSPSNINFELNSVDFSTGKSSMELTFQGLTFSQHKVKITLNGEIIGEISGSNRDNFSGKIGVPIGLLQNGTNTLQVQGIGGPGSFSLFDNIKLDYLKKYQANQNELYFYTRNLRVTNVTGFTSSDVRVFDLTYPDAPTRITNATVESADKVGSSFNVSLPAHRRRNMYALADSAIKQVESVTQNNPSTLSATTNQADMLIITPSQWLAESNAWAAHRMNDGLNTVVIDVEDINDEFSFGVRGHAGIRAFLEYTQNNWATPPGYVMLMGDATNDPRNYTNSGDITFMPIKFIDTLYGETISDEALADFDDDGLAEIAVGRIPARSAADITEAFNKVVNFESNLATAPARGSLCASDLPNGYDFQGLCGRIQNELPASIPKVGINRGQPNANALLLAELNQGKYIANYSGHGTTASWENVNFFSVLHAANLTNSENLTIFLSLTCLNGYFVRPNVNSLSETLLKADNGGAVAVWSSTGETTPDVQEVMAKRFFNQLGNNPDAFRIGGLIRDAKSVLVGGRDVRRSWGLLGDPALKVKLPVAE